MNYHVFIMNFLIRDLSYHIMNFLNLYAYCTHKRPNYAPWGRKRVTTECIRIPLTTIYDSCRKIGVGGVFNLLVLDNQSKFSVTDFRLNYWVLLGTNEGCAL